ncbi:hypothetical protein GCM10011515_08590 [Tsuneonella deserti]|uniref:Intracellular septation protein A n=1 Tax=Tsuneonella deserti TaxID=2035528 RepID=A0ABQ1S6H8_9SPHN|nr:hypothetical protein [Tsuneonella deserti]GGD91211.1 hypothetical protein GCM10011515_08590 [Tsuneonella deserti]
MLLVLQIAGGIVLAWYVITHWNKLTKALGALASFALGGMVVAGGLWALAYAAQRLWSNLDSIGYCAFVTFMFALGIAGLVGMGVLLNGLFPGTFKFADEKDEKKRGDGIFAVVIFAFFIHLMLLVTLVGYVFPGIDGWSRANGYKDTGIMFAGLLVCQYVWWPAIKLVDRRALRASD